MIRDKDDLEKLLKELEILPPPTAEEHRRAEELLREIEESSHGR